MKIGLIGLGKQGTYLYHTFNKILPNSITHCYDPFVQNQFGLIQTPDLLNSVDAVIIASPHGEHAKQTIEAIQANKHVFVEKPIALDGNELKEIGKIFDGHHVVIRQNLKYRYLFDTTPCIGQVRYVQLTYTRKRGVPLTPYFTRKEFAKGGVLADLGSHLIDTAFYLSGWPDVKEFRCIPVHLANATPNPIGTDSGWTDWNPELDREIHSLMDVEDRCFVNIECENCLMSLDIGWISHQKPDEIFYLKVVGDEGTFYAHKMEIVRPDGSTEIIGKCRDHDLDELSAQDFVNEITGQPVRINQSMAQFKKVLNIIEPAYSPLPPESECPTSALGGTTSSPCPG